MPNEKQQTVEELLQSIQQRFAEIEITMSAVTLAEIVHGVARATHQSGAHAGVPSSMN